MGGKTKRKLMGEEWKPLIIYLLGVCAILFFAGCRIETHPGYNYVHAVSTATPEASEIGMRILNQGGNAADAAIAISFALNVTEPAMSGIGGGTQIQIKLPGKKPFAINGTTLSPAATPTHFNKDSLNAYLRTTIPSTVRVMQYLYDNYSSKKLTWGELIQPSIRLIEKGFSWGYFRTKVMTKYRRKLTSDASIEPYLFDSDSLRLERLSLAFQALSEEGPMSFYMGSIARAINRDMINHDGWITINDLHNFPLPKEINSVHFEYNGYDIYTQPEPCGGWVVQEILQKLGELRKMKGKSIYALAEAINYGHQVRQQKAKENLQPEGETTHFSVMDQTGMCLSVTSSINAYYGAGVANADYGFLYNSYMDDFNFDDPENKYALGPGKMAYSSMSPTIVMKDDQVVLIIGSPGSARIISTTAQLINYYISGSYPPDELLDIPRIHAQNNQVYFELPNMQTQFINDSLKWQIINPGKDLARDRYNPYFGGVHAILWTGAGYKALADPRRDGVALTR